MAVLLDTSLGEIVIDLHSDLCPLTCKNFLKLCKIKYYNNCIFHDVKKDFIAQTGDPTGTGSGGDSLYKHLYGEQARFFVDEIHPKLTHDKIGTVAMASAGENLNASQFYITLRAGLDYLDGKHTVFGEVAEGLETLMRINEAYVDEKGRPYKNIRIKHVSILDDPFDDPPALADMIPEKSPELKPPAEGEEVRLEDDWVPMDELMAPEEVDKSLRQKEAHSRAVVLEMIGDIPDADMAPPENVLFICKLNPVTQEDDLNTLFSRFGKIISADIIRDYKTGDSLCYGFIEFETKEACEAAYFKMDNVLIDDRRIHVDFSQSVAKLWTRFRKFGAKDTNEYGPDAPTQRGKKGCFNCGEFGHLKKDCPKGPDGAKGAPPNGKPRYTLKEPAGQRGDPRNRYEMVFDENSDASGSDKPDGRGSSRGYHPQSERPFKRPSKDDDNEKRARQRLSPRERNEDRGYQTARDVRMRDRDETRVEERSRGRDDDTGRQARLPPPPPPPSSRGRYDERGRQPGRDDRYRERVDSRDERGDSRRDERSDSRRDERGSRREEKGDSRRNEREPRREEKGDFRRDERVEPRREERGEQRREERGESRKDEKGEPRREEKVDSRTDERVEPRKDDRGESRRGEKVDSRRDDRGEPRREERGETRRDERGDFRRDERGEPRREDKGGLRRDEKEPRREEKVELRREDKEPRREEKVELRRDDKEPRREEKVELRRDDKESRREDKVESRKDERELRREEKVDTRRDDGTEPRRDERGDYRRDERGESRKDHGVDSRREERGNSRRDDRFDARKDRNEDREERPVGRDDRLEREKFRGREDMRKDERVREKDDEMERRARPPIPSSKEKNEDRSYQSREERFRERGDARKDERFIDKSDDNERRGRPLMQTRDRTEERSQYSERDDRDRTREYLERDDKIRDYPGRDDKVRDRNDDSEKRGRAQISSREKGEDRGPPAGREERMREKDDDSERRPRMSQFSSRERVDDPVPPGRDERPRDKEDPEKRARSQFSSRDDRSYFSGRDGGPRERPVDDRRDYDRSHRTSR